MTEQTLAHTPLYNLHLEHGAKMVPFAGYAMPVQYALGILREHLHTRAAAGLFDVSHMGQVWLRGEKIVERIEKLVPASIQDLASGHVRYSLLLNKMGGIEDDLMITRPGDDDTGDTLFLVVNASRKYDDVSRFICLLGNDVEVRLVDDRALLALQGPRAADVLARYCEALRTLAFMQAGVFDLGDYGTALISRSGYTGEDGFEISVPAMCAEAFARALLRENEVELIGLGARDSLRLEAGMPLYGHDLDDTTSPVEANLLWAIGKNRRVTGGFIGDQAVLAQLRDGAPRRRVGLCPVGRTIAREGVEIQDLNGRRIGTVTSGGFSPSLDKPVAMGYVETAFAVSGTDVNLVVRGNPVAAQVVPLPFVSPRYVR